MSFYENEYHWYTDTLIISVIVIMGLSCALLVYSVVYSYEIWLDLKTTIPNMDCSELIQTQNKYDYWLDGEHKDSWFFETHDLFDMWYEQIKGKGCY